MKVFSNLRAARDTVYNKVWHTPKGKLSAKVRGVCDGLPHKQRLMVVSVMLCTFVLIAFFVFGHACYKSRAGSFPSDCGGGAYTTAGNQQSRCQTDNPGSL